MPLSPTSFSLLGGLRLRIVHIDAFEGLIFRSMSESYVLDKETVIGKVKRVSELQVNLQVLV